MMVDAERLSNPKLQVNLNLNARLLVVSQVQVCHLHFLNSKRVFILWLCNLAHRSVCSTAVLKSLVCVKEN